MRTCSERRYEPASLVTFLEFRGILSNAFATNTIGPKEEQGDHTGQSHSNGWCRTEAGGEVGDDQLL